MKVINLNFTSHYSLATIHYFTSEISFSKVSGSETAISASIFLSKTIPAFLKADTNLLYVNPCSRVAAFMRIIQRRR